ncbi:hypothetical protein Elgi_37240 [Paenibacillus elgii]|uniref:hypothetical protein n=1 Tax=Paenibacillus elgii TaxID=189691 RepID=UPI002D7CCDE0|nr:hypothetical protein Elgi_37240 [Paenibacillus elgii]
MEKKVCLECKSEAINLITARSPIDANERYLIWDCEDFGFQEAITKIEKNL